MSLDYSRENILITLSNLLSDDDLSNSLKVEEVALQIARTYLFDENITSTAALLHNCGKIFSDEEHEDLSKKLSIELTDFTDDELYDHALISERIAKKYFNITNIDILNSIKNYVYGRQNMSDLEKIIFIACFIVYAPKRLAIKVKNIVEEDFDEAFQRAFTLKISRNIKYFIGESKRTTPQKAPSLNENPKAEKVDTTAGKKFSEYKNKIKKIYEFKDKLPSSYMIGIGMAAFLLVLVVFAFYLIGLSSFKKEQNVKRAVKTIRPSVATVFYVLSPNNNKFEMLIENSDLKRGYIIEIPDDLVVNVPGFGSDKLANLSQKVKPELLTKCLSNLIGLRIKNYVKAEFGGELITNRALSEMLDAPKDSNIDNIKRKILRSKIIDPAYVLLNIKLPAEPIQVDVQSFSQIKEEELNKFFTKTPLVKNLLFKDRVSVAILNGTGKPGIGNKIAVSLMDSGYKVVHLGNAKTTSGADDFSRANTEIVAEEKISKKTVEKVIQLLGKGKVAINNIEGSIADVTILIGKDLL